MPTQAEASRQAQEDAMARQAMMQAAQQRQQAEAISRAQRMGDARSANELAIAQMQIGASRDLEASRAAREEKANQALMDRQLALVNAGKGMSEAERATLDMQRNDPRAALGEVIAKQLRSEMGEEPQMGGAKPPPDRRPAATDVMPTKEMQPASGSPEFLSWYQGRYGPGAIPSGYPGGDPNAGLSVRQTDGSMKLVAPVAPRAAATPDAVRAQMMPQAPFQVTPPSYEMGDDVPMGTPGMVTSRPQPAPMPEPMAAPALPQRMPAAPADKPKKSLGERYLDKELGLPADEQEAVDLKKRTLAAAEAGDQDAQAMADQQGWQYVKRKVRAANVETDPVIQQGLTALADQAKQRGDWFLFNEDKKHAKASGNADAMLMQIYNQMVDMGVPKADAKKRLQAELVKLNIANDIQWGLPTGIQQDK